MKIEGSNNDSVRNTHRPQEEFYDIKADPYELNNLAADPNVQSLMTRYRQQLKEWMAEQGDHGIETEMQALDHQI